MRKLILLIVMTVYWAPAHGFTYWNDIRYSALLPDTTITIRIENPSGAGIENYLLYTDNGIEETTMTLIADGPSTWSATVPGPLDVIRTYGFRLIQSGELDFMPVRIATGSNPDPQDLTRVATDAVGDEIFGYTNLDLTDCRFSFTSNRLYAGLQNAGGGFPVSQGLTFFGYLLGIANPAIADPDTVWGLMYTYEQAGIISPGLYRIQGSGLSDLVKIGEVEVQEFPASNELRISCLIANLMADPYFTAWYDPSDPVMGVAAFTQRITFLGGAAEADRSPGGRCYLRDLSISPVINQLPQIQNAEFLGTGPEAYAQIEYADGDGNCPVLSEILFDGNQSFPMYPQTLDYSTTVIYRSDSGIAPLADETWTTAVFRFSDNQIDVIEYEETATGIADHTGEKTAKIVAITNTPNPFSASTAITFDLPAASRIRIAIYDVTGKLVSTIADEHFEAGPQVVRWNARADRGETVGSGIYFVRLFGDGLVQTSKMVLLR
jgi:hypothetical protein